MDFYEKITFDCTVVSYELFNKKRWERINREDAEKRIECYRRADGVYYCKDKYEKLAY